MDTSDPEIIFNDEGLCSHCLNFEKITQEKWPAQNGSEHHLEKLIDSIKMRGKGKDYDCVIGISGGLDSSYLALRAKDWGLRAFLVHVDAGWNSELAVMNISNLVKKTGFDYDAVVVDWETMRNLQVTFLRSGVENQDIPQDHIFVSELLHYAKKLSVGTSLSGGNFATESILPNAWGFNSLDSRYIKSVVKKYGDDTNFRYRYINFFDYYVHIPYVRKIKSFRPLNYINYTERNATEELCAKINWNPYPFKHYESVFTSFFQGIYLPKRLGIDKRKAHLSSLILSGQLQRKEAITILKRPPLEKESEKQLFNFVAKKLEISSEDLENFIEQPRSTVIFRSNEKLYEICKYLSQLPKILKP